MIFHKKETEKNWVSGQTWQISCLTFEQKCYFSPEDVCHEFQRSQLEFWNGFYEEGGDPYGGDVKDGGVWQLGQLDHVTHQVGQLTALGVQADDVAISDIAAKKKNMSGFIILVYETSCNMEVYMLSVGFLTKPTY